MPRTQTPREMGLSNGSACRFLSAAILAAVALLATPACTSHPPKAPEPGAVQWDLEYLVPVCSSCRAQLPYKAPECARCGRGLMWIDPELPNTPEGAFQRLKLAVLFDELEWFRQALVAEDAARMERSVRLGRSGPFQDRAQAVDTRVLDVHLQGDLAVLQIGYRGFLSQVEAVRKGGVWKISLQKSADDARIAFTRSQMRALSEALESYRQNAGEYPPEGNSSLVRALSGDAGAGQSYFRFDTRYLSPTGEVLDPWGRPLRFLRRGAGFEIYSVGPDGVDDGTSGDDVHE